MTLHDCTLSKLFETELSNVSTPMMTERASHMLYQTVTLQTVIDF